ncbi:hypothetical protein BJ742DRAFT_781170 [Cladochytrium replicatum]|nr:hypothetical protein BJ742DRAFT_781170 [Cladochytrium replicatum]
MHVVLVILALLVLPYIVTRNLLLLNIRTESSDNRTDAAKPSGNIPVENLIENESYMGKSEIQTQYLSVVESLKEQMIHLMIWNAVLVVSLFFGRSIWEYLQGILHGVKETAAEIFQVGSPLGPEGDNLDAPGRGVKKQEGGNRQGQ